MRGATVAARLAKLNVVVPRMAISAMELFGDEAVRSAARVSHGEG